MVPLDEDQYDAWLAIHQRNEKRGLGRAVVIVMPAGLWLWGALSWIAGRSPQVALHYRVEETQRDVAAWSSAGLQPWLFSAVAWTAIWFAVGAGVAIATWLGERLASFVIAPRPARTGDFQAVARTGGYGRDGQPGRWIEALEPGEQAVVAIGEHPVQGMPVAGRGAMITFYLAYVLLAMVLAPIAFFGTGASGLAWLVASGVAVTVFGFAMAVTGAAGIESSAIALVGWLSLLTLQSSLYAPFERPPAALAWAIGSTAILALGSVIITLRGRPHALLVTDRAILGLRRGLVLLAKHRPFVAEWRIRRPAQVRIERRLWFDQVTITREDDARPLVMRVTPADADELREVLGPATVEDTRRPVVVARVVIPAMALATTLLISYAVGKPTAAMMAIGHAMLPAYQK